MRTLSTSPDHVVFGDGAESEVPALLEQAGARRVLLVALARHDAGARRLATALGDRSVGVFTTDLPQVPGEVADAAVALALDVRADWVLAHGGGTPIGIAKAVALGAPVKVGAIPTTYAGSERTDIWGITRDGRKTTGRDPRVRPRLVAYDPSLTLDLPVRLSLQSLFNALAHSIEALYDAEAPRAARRAATDSLAPLISGIRGIAADPHDPAGRAAALYGAYLASTALCTARMALHHKLAHVLGGSFGTPHAPTHSLLLSHTFGFNAPFAPAALEATRAAWRTDDPPGFLYDLQRSLGLDTSLRAVGITASDLDRLADLVIEQRYANPRPYDRAELLTLLAELLDDRRPTALKETP